MTAAAETPEERFLGALESHSPVLNKAGASCTCGEWSAKKYSDSAFNEHLAGVLATLHAEPVLDKNGIELLRHFYGERDEDVSGTSGTGRVFEAMVFEGGKVVVVWLIEPYSIVIFDSIEDVRKVHGHDGKTRLVAADDELPMTQDRRMAQSRHK